MDVYLVERYLPGRSEAEIRDALRRVQDACNDRSARGTRVRYLGSVLLPVEEALFCRFESEGPEAVAEVSERAQLPFARITPGVAITPDDSSTHQPTVGGTAQ